MTYLYGADGNPLLPNAAAPSSFAIPYGNLSKIMALLGVDNGSSFDLAHGTKEIVALASASRTATTNSADFTNVSARGVYLFLNVTVASGAGGLQVAVQYKDPISGTYSVINALPTAVVATGLSGYALYPSVHTASGLTKQATNASLARTWRVQVAHGNTDPYTYSVSACYLN